MGLLSKDVYQAFGKVDRPREVALGPNQIDDG